MNKKEKKAEEKETKKEKGKVRERTITRVTVIAGAVAVLAVVLIGATVISNLDLGRVSSAVTSDELSSLAAAEDNTNSGVTVVDISNDISVSSGKTSSEEDTKEADSGSDSSSGSGQTQVQIEIQGQPGAVVSGGTVSSGTSSGYIIPYSSSTYLNYADIAGMSKSTLRLARNEIYARHGYIFNSSDLRNYFNSKSWYTPSIPSSSFNDNTMLTAVERANIAFIKKYE